MTDGSEQCLKLILERIDNIKATVDRQSAEAHEYRREMRDTVAEIKDSVHRHQDDVDGKFTSMNGRVDGIEKNLSSVLTDRAKVTGAVKALATLWTVLVFVWGIVSFSPDTVKAVINGAMGKS